MADLIELESKVAYLEKHINELSDVIYRQQQAIDELETLCEELRKGYLTTLEQGQDSADEKPPHY